MEMLQTATMGNPPGPDDKAAFIDALETLSRRDSIERENSPQDLPVT